jgi:ethylmalonyl-CoA mutase
MVEPESRDRPWVMRTYSGHSTAKASNELYRMNLAKGQTGLSIAFDLPTQTGYDPDAPEARGEVGKVGVPVVHSGHMAELMDGIPLDQMNTSMTINATAAWLLALYVARADATGVAHQNLSGTVQNDIIKEYLSRGTYIFPPEPSQRLTVDTIAWTVRNAPGWNPINVCSYHLQEAGATPVQELAFALATAIGVVDAVRDSGQLEREELPAVVGRISFFCNAGIRFVEETCKMRAFTAMWDQICAERWGVDDPKRRRFRYGVQVNSLGLTEQQPENNVPRIALEALGVILSRGARARAIQLPAWNEALGLPHPWDQQWSLRIQQILAYETDLLEYGDIFDGSRVIEGRTSELIESAQSELDDVLALGGAFEAIETMKARLVASQSARTRRIESAEQVVVGVNRFTTTEASPLGGAGSILQVDPAVEAQLVEDVDRWRKTRDTAAVTAALDRLRRDAEAGGPAANLMDASIALAHAGGTTGEWAGALRQVWGEYRAPTGLGDPGRARAFAGARGMATAEGGGGGATAEGDGGDGKATAGGGSPDGTAGGGSPDRTAGGPGPSPPAPSDLDLARLAIRRLAEKQGGPPRLLVAKPGLDGHSNGAEQVAVAARDAGFEVVYQGIRQTPEEIAAVARDEDVDVVGLSILSGSHMNLVADVQDRLRLAGVDAPLVVGGIIPPEDAARLIAGGVAAVYTPKDYQLGRIMADLAELVTNSLNPAPPSR